MKIAINASLLYDAQLRGWNRYTLSLLEEMKAQGIKLYLYSRKPVNPGIKQSLGTDNIIYRDAPSSNYFVWEQRTLPKWCQQDGVDLFHSPFNYGIPFSCPCPKVLTLHDAIEEKYYRPIQSRISRLKPSSFKFQILQKTAPKNADHVITVSHHAKADIVEVFKIPEQKISVTYESHPKNFETILSNEEKDNILKKYSISSPYFFYIGGFDKRKNIPFLLEAFASANLPDQRLVLGGSGDSSKLLKRASELGIKSSVDFPGYIDDADLPAIYQGASAFIYPSFYEGFGLQVCESMASGCPTFVSDRTSLPEILGDGGLTFNLENPEALAQMMSKISQDSDLKEELSQKALKRSKSFNWANTAKQTIEIYKDLLNKN